MTIIWNQRTMVEYAPGCWKRLGELSEAEHAAMQELGRRSNELRAELAGMLARLAEANRAHPGRFDASAIPGEVLEMGDPDDLSYLRAQRAVDAMRAQMTALGLE